MKRFAVLFALLALLFSPYAWATQNSLVAGNFPTTSPYSGLTFVNNVNTAMTVLSSNNAGSSAPSYAVSDMVWADTSNNLLKFTPNASTWYPIAAFGGGAWSAISDGVPDDAVTSTGSANAYVVTYSPAPTALFTGHLYKWITNFAVTGSATVNFNGLGAKTLKKLGGTNLASGDIGSGQVVTCVYDGTNCQVTSQLATSATGVSSIATTSPVCGGTITTSGTLSLCSQANNTVLANISGGSASAGATAVPVATSWGVGTTSAAAGNVLHSPASNTLALSTNGTDGLKQYSDQGVTVGAPTGGDEGSGSLNAAALYVQGVAVATGSSSGLTGLHTINASAASSIVFNSTYITSTYNTYGLECDSLYTSDGGDVYMTVSTNNGSSYLSANYIATTAGGAQFNLSNSLGTSASSSGVSRLSMKFSNPSATQNFDATWDMGIFLAVPSTMHDVRASGTNSGTTPINAIKVFDGNGGTITANCHLYGYAN